MMNEKVPSLFQGIQRARSWLASCANGQRAENGFVMVNVSDFRDILGVLLDLENFAYQVEERSRPLDAEELANNPNIINLNTERQKRVNKLNERTKPL